MTDYVGWVVHMVMDDVDLVFTVKEAVAIWCDFCDPGSPEDPNNCEADYTIDATSVLGEAGYDASYCQRHMPVRIAYDRENGFVWAPCRRMLPPYEAHGAHDNCPGLAAHPNTMIGKKGS